MSQVAASLSSSQDVSLRTQVAARLRDVPDFPKPGVLFKDMMPVLADPRLLSGVVDEMAAPFMEQRISRVVGVEARGFLLGSPIALKLRAGLAPARKPGKLPWRTRTERYALEYGEDALQLQEDALGPGDRVLIVDDLLATGGTADAAARLVRQLGGEVVGFSFLIALDFLPGRERLGRDKVHALLSY